MSEKLMKAMAIGGRAIPGQSLTNDPENPAPFEQPPKYTTVHDACEEIFDNLVDEEVLPGIIDALDDLNPIMDITQAILFKGFTDGKWNGDLMIMLIEPVAYILLALAERFGIEPMIYHGEEDDDEEVKTLGIKMSEERIAKMKKFKELGKVPNGIVDKGIMDEIKDLPEMESLLGSKQKPEAPSLMEKPEEEIV